MNKKKYISITIILIALILITFLINNFKNNKLHLKNVIANYQIKNTNYTPISLNNFYLNLNTANNKLNNIFITKKDIYSINNTLSNSYNNLQEKPNKEALIYTLKHYKTYDLNNYTTKSVNKYNTIISNTNKILQNEDSTFKDIQNIQNELNTIDDLILTTYDMDQLNKIKNILSNIEKRKYITSSIKFVDEALLNIIKIIKYEEITNTELKEIISIYTEQLNKITLKGDKTNYINLLNKIYKINKNEYSTSSYSSLENTLKELNYILESDEFTQEEIDNAYEKLIKSYNQLEKLKKGKFKIYVNYLLLSNNHVGNEWGAITYYKDDDFYYSKTLTGIINSEIELKTEIIEYDKYPDYDIEYVILKLKNNYKYSTTLRIRENKGRYTGNIAEWKVTYTVKQIN